MILSKSSTLALTLMLGLISSGAMTSAKAADLAKGESVYKKCVACHMVGDGAKTALVLNSMALSGAQLQA